MQTNSPPSRKRCCNTRGSRRRVTSLLPNTTSTILYLSCGNTRGIWRGASLRGSSQQRINLSLMHARRDSKVFADACATVDRSRAAAAAPAGGAPPRQRAPKRDAGAKRLEILKTAARRSNRLGAPSVAFLGAAEPRVPVRHGGRGGTDSARDKGKAAALGAATAGPSTSAPGALLEPPVPAPPSGGFRRLVQTPPPQRILHPSHSESLSGDEGSLLSYMDTDDD